MRLAGKARNKVNQADFFIDISWLRLPGKLRPLSAAGKKSFTLPALRCSTRRILASGFNCLIGVFSFLPGSPPRYSGMMAIFAFTGAAVALRQAWLVRYPERSNAVSALKKNF